jgi:hypothetical protein
VLLLTVRSLGGFWVECASGFHTIVLLCLSRVATNNLMLLRETGSNSELMKSCFTPHVLLPDPAALDKIPFTFLYASAVGVVKMSLPS